MSEGIEVVTRSTDFGQRCAVASRLHMSCGHLHQIAHAFDKWHDPKRDEETAKLIVAKQRRQLEHARETHDCATYERDETIRKVTARLSRGFAR